MRARGVPVGAILAGALCLGGSAAVIGSNPAGSARAAGLDQRWVYAPAVGDNSYNFAVDLDSPDPVLQGEAGQEDFPGFEINVSQSLDSAVKIDFTGLKHLYTWVLLVDYDDNGKQKTTEVDGPDGAPFTLTGIAPSYNQVFEPGGGDGYVLTGGTTPGSL